jgi:heavy metal sensor kinase
MSLTTRLSVFFLSALAVVLVGFSTVLYALAQSYLSQQVDDRLTAALDTLESAVDREPDGLEWDADERHLPLGREKGPEMVCWVIHNGAGQRLDRSFNLGSGELDFAAPADVQASDRGTQPIERDGQDWRLAWRRVRAAATTPTSQTVHPRRHQVLVLTAGMSLEPGQATLRRLGLALVGLSAAVWLTAALVGWWMCRRALAPVARMAKAARAMRASDLNLRLPGPVVRDELGDLHQAFNGLLDRLQEAFERQQRFTGDASHQLRTPLAAMLGQVDVALRRERSDEEYRRVLALVQVQAKHLSRIVEALLFLARADAEADLGRLESVDLAAWLPVHLEGWAGHPRAGDLKVSCQNSAVVKAQPMLLGQLLDNLIDNALKYSEAGKPVAISVQGEGDATALCVQDAGPGIAAEDLPHIFEAFYRSPAVRRQGRAGVGLGLAMARRIARALGGSLVAESQEGHGSRFRLRLPLPERARASGSESTGAVVL